MALVNQSHIVAYSENPLDAKIEGTDYQADLVASFAFHDGAEKSALHYNLTLGQVYSAMAFYHDNYEAIQKQYEELKEIGRQIGAVDATEHLAMIRERAKKKSESNQNG